MDRKKRWYDIERFGPGALDPLQACLHGLLIGAIVLAFAVAQFGVSLRAFGFALLGGTLAGGTSYFLWKAEQKGWPSRLFPTSHRSSEDDYSYQQSLVVQGHVNEALASYEELIATTPNAIEPRIRAAELYARRPETARRAADLYREVLRLPSLPLGQEAYVTNRLVDVLVGPLGDYGRAMIELRRLIGRHPGTKAAKQARLALARLMEDAPNDRRIVTSL
jgi:tetratricopeptide (TPR) repeat protein